MKGPSGLEKKIALSYHLPVRSDNLLFRQKSGFGKAYPGQEPLPAFRGSKYALFQRSSRKGA